MREVVRVIIRVKEREREGEGERERKCESEVPLLVSLKLIPIRRATQFKSHFYHCKKLLNVYIETRNFSYALSFLSTFSFSCNFFKVSSAGFL